MKTKSVTRDAGYLLIEYMIYMGLAVVVIGVAFAAFYKFFDHSRDLSRNAEDIIRVLRVGELWRADIRNATAPPQLRTEEGLVACEMTSTNSRIAYVFADGAVWRQAGDDPPRQVLPRVRASQMIQEQRDAMTCWRWELELQTRKKVVRVRPLFTFLAVPAQAAP
jgi:hypothetical protein